MTERVVVVGAGFAGLRCARELMEHGVEVEVVEAAAQPGGRVLTVDATVMPPVELGAHVLHGRGAEATATGHLFHEAPREAEVGLLLRGKRLRPAVLELFGLSPLRAQYLLSAEPDAALEDITVADWIARTARSADHALLMRDWLAQNWSGTADELNARFTARPHRDRGLTEVELVPDGGFAALVDRLAVGVPIRCRQPVRRITVGSDGVRLDLVDGNVLDATRCVVTVSPAVVARGHLELVGMPEKKDAAGHLMLGDGCSVALRLDGPAPKDQFVVDVGGGFGLVQAWAGSPWIRLDCKGPDAGTLRSMLADPQRMAVRCVELLPWTEGLREVERVVADWGRNPWIGGVFSVPRNGCVAAAARWQLPERDRLFVAGEACYCGTLPPFVETALESGRVAADELLKRM